MGETVRFDRVKTLEMQERLEKPRAGRIALDDGREIGAEGRDQRRLGGDRAKIGVRDRLGGNDGGAETGRDAPHNGLAEALAIEHGASQQPRERRLERHGRAGLVPQMAPKRVVPGADFA